MRQSGSEYQTWAKRGESRHLWISIPTSDDYDWYRMPDGVFDYGKQYPTCEKCGEKYVPVEGECLRCKYKFHKKHGN